MVLVVLVVALGAVGLTYLASSTSPSESSRAENRDTSIIETSEDVGTAQVDDRQDSGELVLGTLTPLTGDSSHVGPAITAGINLAVADINEAGGIFGSDVVVEHADSGDMTTDLVYTEVDRLLELDVDVVVGAGSSHMTGLVVDEIIGAGVVQISPAATWSRFTSESGNGMFFRTAPSDRLDGELLADLLLDQGHMAVAVVYREESFKYGESVSSAVEQHFVAAGGTVTLIPYASNARGYVSEVTGVVDIVQDADVSAVVVAGYAEAAEIIQALDDRGISPRHGTDVWLPNLQGVHHEFGDPSILKGVQSLDFAIDPAAIADFSSRLEAEIGVQEVSTYGAESYDAVIIVGLAALVANEDSPAAIAAEINGVTRGGEKCNSFAVCKELIENGVDIDYDGLGGAYEFDDNGDPTKASYRIDTFGDDGPAQSIYVFAN